MNGTKMIAAEGSKKKKGLVLVCMCTCGIYDSGYGFSHIAQGGNVLDENGSDGHHKLDVHSNFVLRCCDTHRTSQD